MTEVLALNFIKPFLRIIALLPGVLQGTEALFGPGTGAQKRAVAVDIAAAAMNLVEAVTSKQVTDSNQFEEGLGVIIDGLVTCFNASIWAKQ